MSEGFVTHHIAVKGCTRGQPDARPRLPGAQSSNPSRGETEWSLNDMKAVRLIEWQHPVLRGITITTGKSKHKRTAIIPLYDDLRHVLANIPKASTTILTNARKRPWTANGFGTAFNRAKIAATMDDRDLHFHDLRGTAATKFYVASVPERVIAEIMAWEEEHVSKIIRRYVDRTAATKALIRQINERRT